MADIVDSLLKGYQLFSQVEATEEELSEQPDTDDTPRNTEVVYNERLLEEAMRRSMSMWRFALEILYTKIFSLKNI